MSGSLLPSSSSSHADLSLYHRATVGQLLEHRWVTGAEVATVQLTSALEELRRFNARRKFKAAVGAVKAANVLKKNFHSSSGVNDSETRDPDAVEGDSAELDAVTVELDDGAP